MPERGRKARRDKNRESRHSPANVGLGQRINWSRYSGGIQTDNLRREMAQPEAVEVPSTNHADQPLTLGEVVKISKKTKSGKIITPQNPDGVILPEVHQKHLKRGGSVTVDYLGNVGRQDPPRNLK